MKVPAWQLSITLEAGFCIKALKEVLAAHGRPDTFNTDLGRRFTSLACVQALQAAAISIDGKVAWRDKGFVERLWRTVKYEEI